ncbi:Protein-N(5)-glutamine methyltransferase PrmC [Pseudonocardia sp. Ae168_Ps1]|uniref:peptide chain release factor N(5)-glutamine methyltransferase n=1 Tax=unclassified Pseudonocardia TaxID=2619320 RepID=UPI00094B2D57|nr:MULTISPECIES: peptide chain release factor N(5)-glutamine methyltransferase [unclassified Pseudonocardia]OLL73832.1 Protein-N(5)-glutamine methyltransferase PrmC [Pseudonocardia sp. Ae150A_Ps1]OLL79813.1 Protein-N(5)-glutamine methyltransferase PrmC [Pseudonocardia sp. Ae168_Ps1]OLL86054.1 Protein-N(5)-glutamine methyltransferase PrmC [Pseudonocardia sp. Ae263_Ps1]
MNRLPLRVAIAEAERTLAASGVASPRVDAELLAAHVSGRSRSTLLLTPLVDPGVVEELKVLVKRRATREPLQHILGTAVLGPVEVAVGPGVFTPRPETELLFEWGLGALRDVRRPVVLDLCTGSGALALAFAVSRPDAAVHALEADPTALVWTRRNLDAHVGRGGRPVTLHAADVRWPDLLVELEGRVDLVVCNPPYVPDGTPVPPEVERWDPPGAVFGGPDGTEIIQAVVRGATGWLRHGGALAIEHDDTHGDTVPALLRRRRTLAEVTEHTDLTGRPRFVTARRVPFRD